MRRLLCLALVVSSSIAFAQDVDLMTQAREAADAGRLVEARDLLVQLMESEPSPGAAANLAMVRRGLGELVDAQGLLERLVAGEFGELDAGRQEQATALLREVRSEVSSISVVVHGAPPGALVRLGGRRVGSTDESNRAVFPSDPGTHVVQIESNGRTIDREVEVATGSAVRVEVDFTDDAAPPTPEQVASDPINADIVDDSPASPAGLRIGISVAVGVVVVAVAIALAFVLSGGSSLPSQPDGFLGSTRL